MRNIMILAVLGMIFLTGCKKLEPEGKGDHSIKLSTNSVSFEKDASIEIVTAKNGWQGIVSVVFNGKYIDVGRIYGDPDGKYIDVDGNVIDDPSITVRRFPGRRIKITCEWFEIVQISNKEVYIYVVDNDTGEEREFEINFLSGPITESVTVTQRAE